MTDQASGQPLPVLEFVLHSYVSLLANWLTAVKLSWGWILLTSVLLWLLNRYMPALDGVAQLAPPSVLAFALMAAVFLALLFATASTAVGWHRMILLAAEPPLLGIDLGKRVRAYAWKLTLFSFIVFVLFALLGLFSWLMSHSLNDSAEGYLDPVLAGVILLMLSYVAARYGLAFPAAALERSIGFGAAATLAKGHIWPMTLGMALVGLPDAIADQIFDEALMGSALAAHVLRVAIYLLTVFAAFTFLSLCYRHIVLKREPA